MLLANTQEGPPVLPEILQLNWSTWRRSGHKWPLATQKHFEGIGSRRVRWWGPVTVLCPWSEKGLGGLIAYRVGVGEYGVVEDDARGSWSPRARYSLGESLKKNPRFRIELTGWWREPAGFVYCPTCNRMIYAIASPTPDGTHHSDGDSHPGFTLAEPPMPAFAVIRCRSCNREHVLDARSLGKALYGRKEPTFRLDQSAIMGQVPT